MEAEEGEHNLMEAPKVSPGRGRSPVLDGSHEQEQKRKFDDLHVAVEGTREKMEDLRRQLREKETVARREKSLRRAAERRALSLGGSSETQFVDMYPGSNPSVNEELKHRLAPATRRRNMRGERQAGEEGSGPSPTIRVEGHRDRDRHGPISESTPKSRDRRQQESRPNHRHHRSGGEDYNDGSRTSDDSYTSWDYDPAAARPRGHHWSPSPRRHPRGNHPDYRFYSPEIALMTHDPYCDRALYYRGYFDGSHGTQRTSPKGQKGGPGNLTLDPFSPSGDLGLGGEATGEGGGGQEALSKDDLRASLELEHRVKTLAGDLKSSQEVNKKLQDKLAGTEREFESLRRSRNLADSSVEAQVASRVAALIEEIYTAQQERDEAVMSRLQLANDERDEAILRWKRAQMVGEGVYGDSKDEIASAALDTSIQDLLNNLSQADVGEDIDKYGDIILEKINLTKNRKQTITSEEMQAIIEERDEAIAKYKRLEQEILYLQKNNENLTLKNNQEQALKAEMAKIRKERDSSLGRMKKLEEELQTLRVYYSLHKSLSQEASLRDQFNNTLGSFEGQLKLKDEHLVLMQKDKNELQSYLQKVLEERNSLANRCQQALHRHKEATDKCEKLERLVNVLRKKLTEQLPIKIVS